MRAERFLQRRLVDFLFYKKSSDDLTGSWTQLLGYVTAFQVNSIGLPEVHIKGVGYYNRCIHDDTIGEADRNSSMVPARDAEYIASMSIKTSGTI